MNECRCGKPTRDGAYVCDDCLDHLSRALGDVPWLTEELEVTITRQKGVDYRKVGGGSGGKKATERPSPVVWGASEARTHLKALLVSWALFCASEDVRNSSPDQGLPADNLNALSRWLMWRVDGLALNEIGADAVEEITDAVSKCHRLIDRPADRMYAGRCGGEVEGVECTQDLYATLGAPQIKCGTCGTKWDVKERRKWLLREAEEVLATAIEISRAVSWLGAMPLTADRVRQWAHRDRLAARGHDRNGKPLYRVGDAIDLLAKTVKAEEGAA